MSRKNHLPFRITWISLMVSIIIFTAASSATTIITDTNVHIGANLTSPNLNILIGNISDTQDWYHSLPNLTQFSFYTSDDNFTNDYFWNQKNITGTNTGNTSAQMWTVASNNTFMDKINWVQDWYYNPANLTPEDCYYTEANLTQFNYWTSENNLTTDFFWSQTNISGTNTGNTSNEIWVVCSNGTFQQGTESDTWNTSDEIWAVSSNGTFMNKIHWVQDWYYSIDNVTLEDYYYTESNLTQFNYYTSDANFTNDYYWSQSNITGTNTGNTSDEIWFICSNGTFQEGTELDTWNTSDEIWTVCSNGTFYNPSTGMIWNNITSGWNLDEAWTGTLGYNNLTKCSDTNILKMSGGVWICASDLTGAAAGSNYWQILNDWMTPNTSSGGDYDVNVSNFRIENNLYGPNLNILLGNITDAEDWFWNQTNISGTNTGNTSDEIWIVCSNDTFMENTNWFQDWYYDPANTTSEDYYYTEKNLTQFGFWNSEDNFTTDFFWNQSNITGTNTGNTSDEIWSVCSNETFMSNTEWFQDWYYNPANLTSEDYYYTEKNLTQFGFWNSENNFTRSYFWDQKNITGTNTGNTSTQIWTVCSNGTFQEGTESDSWNTSDQIWTVCSNETFMSNTEWFQDWYYDLANLTSEDYYYKKANLTQFNFYTSEDNFTRSYFWSQFNITGTNTGNTSKEIWSVCSNDTFFEKYNILDWYWSQENISGTNTGNTSAQMWVVASNNTFMDKINWVQDWYYDPANTTSEDYYYTEKNITQFNYFNSEDNLTKFYFDPANITSLDFFNSEDNLSQSYYFDESNISSMSIWNDFYWNEANISPFGYFTSEANITNFYFSPANISALGYFNSEDNFTQNYYWSQFNITGTNTGNTSTQIWNVCSNDTFLEKYKAEDWFYDQKNITGTNTGNTSAEIWAIASNNTFYQKDTLLNMTTQNITFSGAEVGAIGHNNTCLMIWGPTSRLEIC